MRTKHIQHGPIHAVIYPKRRQGVVLLPDTFAYGKDLSADYDAMIADLESRGLRMLVTAPRLVSNMEVIEILPLE